MILGFYDPRCPNQEWKEKTTYKSDFEFSYSSHEPLIHCEWTVFNSILDYDVFIGDYVSFSLHLFYCFLKNNHFKILKGCIICICEQLAISLLS